MNLTSSMGSVCWSFAARLSGGPSGVGAWGRGARPDAGAVAQTPRSLKAGPDSVNRRGVRMFTG